MLKDITLGQYFPGNTPIHRLDPRTKLIMVIVYIVALFSAEWVVSYAIVLAALTAVVLISRIEPKVILRSLKPLLFIIALTGLLNLFYTQGTPLVSFWIFTISIFTPQLHAIKSNSPATRSKIAVSSMIRSTSRAPATSRKRACRIRERTFGRLFTEYTISFGLVIRY